MFVGQRVGPFEIEQEIGSGAMGTVYRARFDKDGKPAVVALKVIAFGLLGNEGAMARFDRESAILKQLRHPHIVRLIATGRYKQTPFIAMEFVDGEPLDRSIARRGRVGWEDVIVYGKQLCDALQYAHDKGIIHRDLKPSNLMVMRDGTLKLTDFGIAKDTDVTALTGQNSTIGTAAYMSPEQCRGDRHLSNKSDLYSLGVVFYELVTGKKPFIAENTVDMFLKHVNEKPVRPSKFIADLPVWLDNLIMFLLEKDKDKRPLDAGTVGKMLEDIEEKVRTQHSAGQDAANARRVDRPFGDKQIDDTDVEAARSLRAIGKVNKPARKAKKKKVTPLIERAWAKAIPVAAALAVVVGLLYYVLRPPTQEGLYAAWQNAGSPDARLKAAERYLKNYGDTADEKTDKVRASLQESSGEKLQAILETRFRNRNAALRITKAQEDEDAEAHDLAWAAMEAEVKGEMAQAKGFWDKLKVHAPTVNDRFGGGWIWFAEKRRADLAAIDVKLAELRSELLRAQAQELPWKFDPTSVESQAKVAIRLGGGGGLKSPSSIVDPNRKPLPGIDDPAKVRRTWGIIADMSKDKPELRIWNLLAIREREQYGEVKPEQAVAARLKMLTEVLDAVEREWTRVADQDLDAEKRDCRNRCRDVTELYADETDVRVKKLVESANVLLAKMQPSG